MLANLTVVIPLSGIHSPMKSLEGNVAIVSGGPSALVGASFLRCHHPRLRCALLSSICDNPNSGKVDDIADPFSADTDQ
jgi:hypothetical protein